MVEIDVGRWPWRRCFDRRSLAERGRRGGEKTLSEIEEGATIDKVAME